MKNRGVTQTLLAVLLGGASTAVVMRAAAEPLPGEAGRLASRGQSATDDAWASF